MTSWRTAKLSRSGKVVVSEHEIQAAFMKWCQAMQASYPELAWFHSVPNGSKLPFTTDDQGRRRCRQAAILKAEGLTPGVLDTHLPVARGGYHSLYIEFKSEDGVLSEDQIRFIDFARGEGNCCIVSRSHFHAAKITIDYLNERIKRDERCSD